MLPVSSALCAQARSESPRAARGQTGRRIRMSNSEAGGWRFSHLRELSGRPFASSRCPAPGQANNFDHGHPLASGFGSMQGLTATLRRVNASRSLAFHLGSMSDSASAYRPHVSRIHPLHPENCNSPNTTRAARQWEPCSCRHGGLHTTRQPCWVAVTTIQPSGLSSHPTGYHHTLPPAPYPSSPRTWVWVLAVDCGSPVACHCTQ